MLSSDGILAVIIRSRISMSQVNAMTYSLNLTNVEEQNETQGAGTISMCRQF